MKDRFEVLDIFRGLFSAMVVFFHMSAFANTPLINNNFMNNSDLFVDFFFVLSGFVIAYSYREISTANKLLQFLKKRWFRIYPLHFVMLLVFVIIELGKHSFIGHIQINNLNNPNNNFTSFISSLLLLNSIKTPGVDDVSWNIPSWSISAEMLSYIAFGGLMLLLDKLNFYRLKKFSYAAIAIAAVVSIVLITGSGKLNYSYDYGFLRGLAGFFTGALCLSAFINFRSRIGAMPTAFFHTAESVLLLIIFVFIYEGNLFKQTGFIYLVLFFLSVLIFAFEKGFISSLLRRSLTLKNMGKYSYSIYMTHAFLLSMFNIVFIRLLHFSPAAYVWLFIPNYWLIYKVSAFTYQHIEMRFAAKFKNLSAMRIPKNDAYAGEKIIAAQ